DICRDLNEITPNCDVHFEGSGPLLFNTDQAISLALVVTEMVANAAKHAYGTDVRRIPLATDAVVDKISQFSPPLRFGHFYRNDLARSTVITLLLPANAVDIEVERLSIAATQKSVSYRFGPNLRAPGDSRSRLQQVRSSSRSPAQCARLGVATLI